MCSVSITLPQFCPRSLTDCQPLAQILVDDKPFEFVCCGHNDGKTRVMKNDRFRVCFHNEAIDEMTDWDERDIKDHISVLAQALSVDANMLNNEKSADLHKRETQA